MNLWLFNLQIINDSKAILKNSPRTNGYKPKLKIGLSQPKTNPSQINPNKYTGIKAINNFINIEIKFSLLLYLIKNFLLNKISLEKNKPAIKAEIIKPIK